MRNAAEYSSHIFLLIRCITSGVQLGRKTALFMQGTTIRRSIRRPRRLVRTLKWENSDLEVFGRRRVQVTGIARHRFAPRIFQLVAELS